MISRGPPVLFSCSWLLIELEILSMTLLTCATTGETSASGSGCAVVVVVELEEVVGVWTRGDTICTGLGAAVPESDTNTFYGIFALSANRPFLFPF